MRMEPGAVTIAHDHAGMEEFLVLEGDLVDSDGTTFGPGDFVSYEAGTHHNSWTESGCLIAVFEWRKPDRHAASRPLLGEAAADDAALLIPQVRNPPSEFLTARIPEGVRFAAALRRRDDVLGGKR